jgi:hypothetical protein
VAAGVLLEKDSRGQGYKESSEFEK